MSSRFDRAYRVSGTTVVNADLWNRIMRDLDTRIVAVEEKKADFEEAEKTLLELALRRINETLLPAAQRIQAVSELGFLIASSDDELTVVPDQQASLRISEGAQRDLFTPSPFVALTRRSTIEDYAIARVVTYDRETGILVFDVESVTGNPGPHNDWDVVALAGAVMAQMATLDETKALRAEVADDKAAVALDKAAAQSARTEAQSARDAAIIAKTGAENALASFMTVYRGALPSAPPDGEQGHFYFDTTLQMARVYTASGWAALFNLSLGGIRQGFFEATNGQDEFTVAGGFTYLNVWVNGVLLTPGVDYTTASPDVTLAAPLSAGDQVAYTGYYATEATDFYSKFDADARFLRFDGAQGLSGEQQDNAQTNIGATATGKAVLTAESQAAARTAIGAQQSHANLTALSGVSAAADRLPYFNGTSSMTYTTLSAFARTLLDDADAAAARATLGAQANLGYTPANKAGDTFTGNVVTTGLLGTGGVGTHGRVRFFSNTATEVGFIGVGVLTGFGDSIGFDINNASGSITFGTNNIPRMTIANTGNVHVGGTFSAGSKSFLIDHPLSPLDRNLRHISVEAPEYQIRYRGVATLEDGQATVDIDAACGMTPGTFAALATDAWVCSLQPQNSFERVKCSDVVDGAFTITSEDGGSTARVAWEVVARRKDPFVMHSPDSDEDGRLIVDFEKPEAPNADD